MERLNGTAKRFAIKIQVSSAKHRNGATYKSQREKRPPLWQESVRRDNQQNVTVSGTDTVPEEEQQHHPPKIHQRFVLEKPIHRPPVNQCFVKANPSSTSWAKHQARAHKMSTAHTQTTVTVWAKGAKAPRKGKAIMAIAIGRSLVCGWGQPTKLQLHRTNQEQSTYLFWRVVSCCLAS